MSFPSPPPRRDPRSGALGRGRDGARAASPQPSLSRCPAAAGPPPAACPPPRRGAPAGARGAGPVPGTRGSCRGGAGRRAAGPRGGAGAATSGGPRRPATRWTRRDPRPWPPRGARRRSWAAVTAPGCWAPPPESKSPGREGGRAREKGCPPPAGHGVRGGRARGGARPGLLPPPRPSGNFPRGLSAASPPFLGPGRPFKARGGRVQPSAGRPSVWRPCGCGHGLDVGAHPRACA